jgi:aryl-alcohol dehydrogenase-like predicted oxidoreductase
VTCAIPGAKTEQQARENVRAASLPPLDPETMGTVRGIYDTHVRAHVHAHW